MLPIWRLIACAVLSVTAVEAAGGTDDPVLRLHRARSLRCTFPAEAALRVVVPDRSITTQPYKMIVVRYDFNDRGTGHAIYETGVPERGVGDLSARWQSSGEWWFLETLPTRARIDTTVLQEQATIFTKVLPEYAEGTSEFAARLQMGIVGGMLNVIPSPPHTSGTCKILTSASTGDP